MRLLFDIEANGLLDSITKIWMLVAVNIDTKEEHIYCNYFKGAKPLNEFKELLDNATELYGHFILGYDLPAIKKITGWVPKKTTKVYDTLLMSQTLNYKRFESGRHRLEDWGVFFKYPKVEHEEWDKYSDDMMHRCREDVVLNLMVLGHLKQELLSYKQKPEIFELLKLSLRNEHKVLEYCALSYEHGWLIDVDKAKSLVKEMEVKLKVIENEINPILPLRVKPSAKEPKAPRWIKNGNYDHHTCRYFGIEPSSGLVERPIAGPFTLIEYVKPDVGSLEAVKEMLTNMGWVPTEWNYKKVGREFIKTSSKLSTDSLMPLGKIGEMIDKYYTVRSRHSTLTGWLEILDANNRLHGDIFSIGTPTGRARHSTLVNVPSGDSMYGHEIRSLFITSPGYKIVGSDSAGNQMRGLLHYLKNPEFTDLVINGDVHSKNAEVLTKVAGIPVTRKQAKTFLYAYLYGAGADKLSLIIFGYKNSEKGKKLKTAFTKNIPGLSELNTKLQDKYHQSKEKYGKPWVPGLDGRRIYIDSLHKSLNYLIQGCEAVTCKAAMVYAMEKLDEAGIPWKPLTWQHDEIQIEVPDNYAEEAARICAESYREAPKTFGVEIMDGESKIGNNWNETH
jgi:DNA polymerase-1